MPVPGLWSIKGTKWHTWRIGVQLSLLEEPRAKSAASKVENGAERHKADKALEREKDHVRDHLHRKGRSSGAIDAFCHGIIGGNEPVVRPIPFHDNLESQGRM